MGDKMSFNYGANLVVGVSVSQILKHEGKKWFLCGEELEEEYEEPPTEWLGDETGLEVVHTGTDAYESKDFKELVLGVSICETDSVYAITKEKLTDAFIVATEELLALGYNGPVDFFVVQYFSY